MRVVSVGNHALSEEDTSRRSIIYAWEEEMVIEAENIEEVNAFLALHGIDDPVCDLQRLYVDRIRVTVRGTHSKRMYDKFFSA